MKKILKNTMYQKKQAFILKISQKTVRRRGDYEY
jgi:hypothetical protein